jgi:uncharacterized protein
MVLSCFGWVFSVGSAAEASLAPADRSGRCGIAVEIATPAPLQSGCRLLTELPVSRSILRVEYEWDEAKAAANLAKHGISFTAAARALDDPRKIETLDDSIDYGEDRIQSICMVQENVLFVVTVIRGENVCRIISARKATRHEQRRYFEGGSPLA